MLTAVACREWARKIASISTLAMGAALSDRRASTRTDTGDGHSVAPPSCRLESAGCRDGTEEEAPQLRQVAGRLCY